MNEMISEGFPSLISRRRSTNRISDALNLDFKSRGNRNHSEINCFAGENKEWSHSEIDWFSGSRPLVVVVVVVVTWPRSWSHAVLRDKPLKITRSKRGSFFEPTIYPAVDRFTTIFIWNPEISANSTVFTGYREGVLSLINNPFWSQYKYWLS